MAYIKQISVGLVAVVLMALCLGTCSVLHAQAQEKTEDEPTTPTEEQLTAVMQNCSNIKQSLAQLQRADSRTRTYLGSAYETIASRFITPLNLRLVKNGKPVTKLVQVQTDFTAAQASFRDDYVKYMREMENLVAIDCVNKPEDFYHKLEEVRARREELREVTSKLGELAKEQYQTVDEMKEKL